MKNFDQIKSFSFKLFNFSQNFLTSKGAFQLPFPTTSRFFERFFENFEFDLDFVSRNNTRWQTRTFHYVELWPWISLFHDVIHLTSNHACIPLLVPSVSHMTSLPNCYVWRYNWRKFAKNNFLILFSKMTYVLTWLPDLNFGGKVKNKFNNRCLRRHIFCQWTNS